MTSTDDRPFAANAMARRNQAREAAIRAYNAKWADNAYAARHAGVDAAIATATTVTNLPDVVGAAKMAVLPRMFITNEEAALLIRTAFEAAGFQVVDQ